MEQSCNIKNIGNTTLPSSPLANAMSRPIYLVVYHSPLFAAHWALWVRHYETNNEQRLGKIMHVQGSANQGFVHEFMRN